MAYDKPKAVIDHQEYLDLLAIKEKYEKMKLDSQPVKQGDTVVIVQDQFRFQYVVENIADKEKFWDILLIDTGNVHTHLTKETSLFIQKQNK